MQTNKKNKSIFIRIILLILGVLSLVNVIYMHFAANPTIAFAIQAVISICLIFYAAFFNRIPKKIHVTFAIICLIPMAFSLFLFAYGNLDNVDFNEDVVIVLGAGVRGETVSLPLAHRLTTAIDYLHQNPDAYIIVCGGLGNRAVITEAEAMARFLITRGVPKDRILLEEQSTSTYENLAFAQEILDEHFPDGFRAVLVTNDFHIYRAVRTAEHVGLNVGHVGAFTDWSTMSVNYLREMLAVTHMWVFPPKNYDQ